MSEPVIECLNLTKHFGNVPAVEDISFTLEPGEIMSILGPSGCGKTTLLRLIAGFETPDRGEIRIQGRLASGGSTHVPPDQRNVGVVFQEYALFPHMTVAKNISFGLQRLSKQEKQERLSAVIELVRLTGLEDRYPYELSGGQQQRVALARTLAPRPVTVLLDEPFSNLDSAMRREMRQEVESILRGHNMATIFVTHDRVEAFATSDRVGVIREGHLDQLDTPDAIYYSPATPFVARMTRTCDFMSGRLYENTVHTEVGKLPCASNNGHIEDSEQVNILVHPDDFRVLPDPQGKCLILSREFRGDETMLVVKTPSGAALRCRHRSYSALTPGTQVTLIPTKGTPFIAFKKKSEA